ncbi:hypothetical protein CK203_026707 [Vitis vinifera]|uniref:Uncharacterized protein n=1 Tax=Vitis vinifera TaxID=29760 RepID=A0A438ITV1_VITVI|nr:hypothetical protein CK203_026707 [Vitis vinifera]
MSRCPWPGPVVPTRQVQLQRAIALLIPPGRKFSLITSGYLTSGILSGRRYTFSGYLISEILSGDVPLFPDISHPALVAKWERMTLQLPWADMSGSFGTIECNDIGVAPSTTLAKFTLGIGGQDFYDECARRDGLHGGSEPGLFGGAEGWRRQRVQERGARHLGARSTVAAARTVHPPPKTTY